MLVILYLMMMWSSVCGEAWLRVLGGRDAFQDEFPFAVRLELRTKEVPHEELQRFCSGAALTSSWVLTAGHCVYYVKHLISQTTPPQLFVRYNSYFPKHKGRLSPILAYDILPGYGKHPVSRYTSIQNDLALLRCEKISVSMYATISAVNYRSLVGHEALVLGFGITNSSEEGTPLQVLNGMLNRCLKKDPATKLMLCVVSACGVVATICGGDSGGPVLHATGMVGINSMSVDDCTRDMDHLTRSPGTSASIVAMLSPHINWIYNTINNKTNN